MNNSLRIGYTTLDNAQQIAIINKNTGVGIDVNTNFNVLLRWHEDTQIWVEVERCLAMGDERKQWGQCKKIRNHTSHTHKDDEGHEWLR